MLDLFAADRQHIQQFKKYALDGLEDPKLQVKEAAIHLLSLIASLSHAECVDIMRCIVKKLSQETVEIEIKITTINVFISHLPYLQSNAEARSSIKNAIISILKNRYFATHMTGGEKLLENLPRIIPYVLDSTHDSNEILQSIASSPNKHLFLKIIPSIAKNLVSNMVHDGILTPEKGDESMNFLKNEPGSCELLWHRHFLGEMVIQGDSRVSSSILDNILNIFSSDNSISKLMFYNLLEVLQLIALAKPQHCKRIVATLLNTIEIIEQKANILSEYYFRVNNKMLELLHSAIPYVKPQHVAIAEAMFAYPRSFTEQSTLGVEKCIVQLLLYGTDELINFIHENTTVLKNDNQNPLHIAMDNIEIALSIKQALMHPLVEITPPELLDSDSQSNKRRPAGGL